MAGLYAPDGSFNVTVVTGSVFTGVMAANGSYNVVLAPGGVEVGSMHPCGAYYVTLTDAGKSGTRAPDGSLYVTDSPYISNGATKVTAVSGTLHPSGGSHPTFFILGF